MKKIEYFFHHCLNPAFTIFIFHCFRLTLKTILHKKNNISSLILPQVPIIVEEIVSIHVKTLLCSLWPLKTVAFIIVSSIVNYIIYNSALMINKCCIIFQSWCFWSFLYMVISGSKRSFSADVVASERCYSTYSMYCPQKCKYKSENVDNISHLSLV